MNPASFTSAPLGRRTDFSARPTAHDQHAGDTGQTGVPGSINTASAPPGTVRDLPASLVSRRLEQNAAAPADADLVDPLTALCQQHRQNALHLMADLPRLFDPDALQQPGMRHFIVALRRWLRDVTEPLPQEERFQQPLQQLRFTGAHRLMRHLGAEIDLSSQLLRQTNHATLHSNDSFHTGLYARTMAENIDLLHRTASQQIAELTVQQQVALALLRERAQRLCNPLSAHRNLHEVTRAQTAVDHLESVQEALRADHARLRALAGQHVAAAHHGLMHTIGRGRTQAAAQIERASRRRVQFDRAVTSPPPRAARNDGSSRDPAHDAANRADIPPVNPFAGRTRVPIATSNPPAAAAPNPFSGRTRPTRPAPEPTSADADSAAPDHRQRSTRPPH